MEQEQRTALLLVSRLIIEHEQHAKGGNYDEQ